MFKQCKILIVGFINYNKNYAEMIDFIKRN